MLRNKVSQVRTSLQKSTPTQLAIYAGFVALVVIACALRYTLIKFESLDYGVFAGWYDQINAMGISSFKYEISNYTAPYTYSLFFFTLLPVSKVVAIKLSMIIFDFVLAYAVYLLVKVFRKDNYAPALAGIATLFLPTVFINSAFWAQIDAMFTAFLMLSLWAGLKGKSKWAWIWFGVAFAIKFQAVFFLPILVFMAFKTVNWTKAWWGALAAFLLVFPPVIFGRSFINILNIYPKQSEQFNGYLTLNAPSLYTWIPNSAFQYFNKAGILLAAAGVIGLIIVGLIYKKFSQMEVLIFATLMLFIIPFLLPQMHERYFYPAEIAALVLAFAKPRFAWIVVAMQVITLFAYIPFLFGTTPVSMKVLTLGVLAIICALGALYMQVGTKKPATKKA
jgi:Gpi18-like mannosyltransferase